jgi:hypothetical protein
LHQSTTAGWAVTTIIKERMQGFSSVDSDGDTARFGSYHYFDKPELVESFPDAIDVIRLLAEV